MRVSLFGDHGARQDDASARDGPAVFQSLRAYLQGNTEQRTARALAVHACASASTRCCPSWRSASRWRAGAATFRWAACGSGAGGAAERVRLFALPRNPEDGAAGRCWAHCPRPAPRRRRLRTRRHVRGGRAGGEKSSHCRERGERGEKKENSSEACYSSGTCFCLLCVLRVLSGEFLLGAPRTASRPSPSWFASSSGGFRPPRTAGRWCCRPGPPAARWPSAGTSPPTTACRGVNRQRVSPSVAATSPAIFRPPASTTPSMSSNKAWSIGLGNVTTIAALPPAARQFQAPRLGVRRVRRRPRPGTSCGTPPSAARRSHPSIRGQ